MKWTTAGVALATLVMTLTLSLGQCAWMIFSWKDICVRLQTKGELTIGRSNRSFAIPDPEDDPNRLMVNVKSLEFHTKRGITVKRVNWAHGRSATFHLDAWEGDEIEGIRALGRRMWDSVPEMGSRFILRAYLFAQSTIVTSLGAMRVEKGDVQIEFEIDELQCVECDNVQFVQIEATVTGSGQVVVRDKNTFGKKLQFGGGASMWLPNKVFTDDDTKTKVDVQVTEVEANSVVFTARLSLSPARRTVYSLLVKPARPEPFTSTETGTSSDVTTDTGHSPGGAELTHAVGRLTVVICFYAIGILLW